MVERWARDARLLRDDLQRYAALPLEHELVPSWTQVLQRVSRAAEQLHELQETAAAEDIHHFLFAPLQPTWNTADIPGFLSTHPVAEIQQERRRGVTTDPAVTVADLRRANHAIDGASARFDAKMDAFLAERKRRGRAAHNAGAGSSSSGHSGGSGRGGGSGEAGGGKRKSACWVSQLPQIHSASGEEKEMETER